MDTSAVDYELPLASIAQTPAEPRDAARLLIDEGPAQAPRHGGIVDLPELVGPGDVVVLNTTRVLPARLRFTRPTGGGAEVLLLEPCPADSSDPGRRWEALVRPNRKLGPGTVLPLGEDGHLIVGEDLGQGRRVVALHLAPATTLDAVLERHGTVPLPPYITAALHDPERYQTVYAERPGSVAAPTAGLHLTGDLLNRVRATGARIVPVELVVGLGTFRPIAVDHVEDHVMHAERYRVPEATMAACRSAERVVAIGTTSVRALESAASTGQLEGRTELFIHGDRPFEIVDALVTNFHQPRSSLLVLIDAFIGPRWRLLYEEALAAGYRFLSFGDAMFLRGARG